jgi:hypothetical protein
MLLKAFRSIHGLASIVPCLAGLTNEFGVAESKMI